MTDQRTCLVTGATSGIGRAAAFGLAALGHRLILVGRDDGKLGRTAAAISGQGGPGEIATFRCDLSLMRDIRSAAEKIARDHRRIDVLINNAGARFLRHGLTDEGIELTLATNHLGHFVLILLLMAPLRNSGQARIISVSSDAHYGGTRAIDNVRSTQGYDGKRQYAESKLAGVLFTYALAERLKGQGIVVNTLDPGCAATNFSRNNGTWSWLKHRLSYFLRGQLRTAAKGAETIVYLADSNEAAGLSGRYFRDNAEMRSSDISYAGSAQKMLWALSVELGGVDIR
jgi:NAD(P)-dependent dehydrogenase (short-subunit alcohol dehydrogenase family)